MLFPKFIDNVFKIILITVLLYFITSCRERCPYTPHRYPIYWIKPLNTSKENLLNPDTKFYFTESDITLSEHDENGKVIGWIPISEGGTDDFHKSPLLLIFNVMYNLGKALYIDKTNLEYCERERITYESYIKYENQKYYGIDTLKYVVKYPDNSFPLGDVVAAWYNNKEVFSSQGAITLDVVLKERINLR